MSIDVNLKPQPANPRWARWRLMFSQTSFHISVLKMFSDRGVSLGDQHSFARIQSVVKRFHNRYLCAQSYRGHHCKISLYTSQLWWSLVKLISRLLQLDDDHSIPTFIFWPEPAPDWRSTISTNPFYIYSLEDGNLYEIVDRRLRFYIPYVLLRAISSITDR